MAQLAASWSVPFAKPGQAFETPGSRGPQDEGGVIAPRCRWPWDAGGAGPAPPPAACRRLSAKGRFEGQARIKQARGGRGWGLRLLRLIYRRLAVFALGAFAVWLIVFVFRFTDSRAPTILALSLVYALAAYVLLPRIVRMSLKILQRKSVPSFTITGDGFPGDPVNLVLIGEFKKLRAAFLAAGWTEAVPLDLTSAWRMVVAFVFDRSYPAAPFSTLFLFGRSQDVGFQKAIDMSPRKRHHVRFWALSLTRSDEPLNNPEFWLNADRPPIDEPALWVGAGTRDTGLSFTKFTFQFTHATDADVNAERDFIVSELERSGRHRRSDAAPRRGNACRPRQSLRDGRGCGGGETKLREGPVRDKSFVVRNMTEADLALALERAAAEGWNPGLHDAHCFYAADPEGFFLGERDGAPIGCVSAVRYGSGFGFLGLYIVKASTADEASALSCGEPRWTTSATA